MSSISIVLTTYNGEKYLNDLLFSLDNQTVKYDELIIVDDCSTDSTFDILYKYSLDKKNVKLLRNAKNIGWIKNFYLGLKYVTCDIILFCDQDDVWLKEKIEIVRNTLDSNKNIMVLAGKMIQIDTNGIAIKNINMKDYHSSETAAIDKIEMNHLFHYNNRPGCLMAIRKDLDKYISFNDFIIPHDSFFWKLGILIDGAFEIDKNFILYRLHDKNASGASNKNLYGKTTRKMRILLIQDEIKTMKEFQIISRHEKISAVYSNQINKIINFNKLRIKFLKGHIYLIVKLLIMKKYYSNFTKLVGDVAFLFGLQKIFGIILFKFKKKRES